MAAPGPFASGTSAFRPAFASVSPAGSPHPAVDNPASDVETGVGNRPFPVD